MKSILKKLIINLISIFVASYLLSGLSFNQDLKTLFFAALVLSLANALLRPFLKILFLPINVITLGLFGWFINVIILYLTTLLVPGFSISAFSLTLFGTTFVFNTFFSYIIVSFILSIITTITSWVID